VHGVLEGVERVFILKNEKERVEARKEYEKY